MTPAVIAALVAIVVVGVFLFTYFSDKHDASPQNIARTHDTSLSTPDKIRAYKRCYPTVFTLITVFSLIASVTFGTFAVLFSPWYWILFGLLILIFSVSLIPVQTAAERAAAASRAQSTDNARALALQQLRASFTASLTGTETLYELPETYSYYAVAFDEPNHTIRVCNNSAPAVLDFSQIISAELISSPSTATTTTQSAPAHGLTRAVVGGVLAGGAGAVVGAATAKSSATSSTSTTASQYIGVRIYTNRISDPIINIVTCNSPFSLNVYGSLLAVISK